MTARSVSSGWVDGAISACITPTLKAAGYRRTGRSWRLDDGDTVRVFNVQASSWNSKQSATFTVNLGVWWEQIGFAPRYPNMFANRRPTENHCTLRTRIGDLMDPGRDHWWELDGTARDLTESQRAAAAVVDLALPWLERCRDPAEAIDWALQHAGAATPDAICALALHRGDRQQAKDLYEQWSAGLGPNSTWHAIDEWAVSAGLTTRSG